MVNSLFIFKNSATDTTAFFGKDLTAVDASSGAVALYFNSQDGSGENVNSVALACASGDEADLCAAIAKDAHREGVFVYDDVAEEYAQKAVTGITSITLNGVPSTGIHAQFNVIDNDSSFTLTAAQSGSLVAVRSGNDIKLPTPEAGLSYTFFAAEDITTTAATIASTTDGTTTAALMFGSITDGGAADPLVNETTITLAAGTATDTVIIRAYCVGTGTTANDNTWLIEGQTGVVSSVTLA